MKGEDSGYSTESKPRFTYHPPVRPELGIWAPRTVRAAAAPGNKPLACIFHSILPKPCTTGIFIAST